MLLFYGANCNSSFALASFVFLIEAVLSFALVVFSIITLRKILENSTDTSETVSRKEKLLHYFQTSRPLSVLSNISSGLAMGSICCLATTNLFRTINVGNQKKETFQVVPISLSCIGCFTCTSLWSVCLLWMELAAPLTKKRSLLKRVKRWAIGLGLTFILSSVALSLTTRNSGFVFLLALLSEILLLIGFWKCPRVLFEAAKVKRNNVQIVARSSKVHVTNTVLEQLNVLREDKIRVRSFKIHKQNFFKSFVAVMRNSGAMFRKYAVSSNPTQNLAIVKEFAFQTKRTLLLVLLSSAGYVATFSIPATGPTAFTCAALMFSGLFPMHWNLLLFLLGACALQ